MDNRGYGANRSPEGQRRQGAQQSSAPRQQQEAARRAAQQRAAQGRVGRQAYAAGQSPQMRITADGQRVPMDGRARPAQAAGQGAQRRPAPQRGARPQASGQRARRTVRKRPKGCALVAVLLVVAMVGVGVFALVNTMMRRVDATITEAGELSPEVQTLPEYRGEQVSFLVCGLDYDDEAASGYTSAEKIGHTDMILYVYFNIKNNTASILQIPRDTFVGSAAATGGTGKINGLYYCAQDTNNRMQALASVINQQLKLPVDFYVTVDMDAVKALVDTIGSIEVYLPVEISDPGTTARIEPGWRHLDGTQIEFVLRNRTSPSYNEQGDIARLRTQQSVYSALFREFKRLTPKDLLMWMEVLTHYVKTDMGLVDLGGIAQSALKLSGEGLLLARPPCGSAVYNNPNSGRSFSLVSLEPEGTAQLLNEHFRPEGQSFSAQQLDIQELSMNLGIVPAEIKTMTELQADEAPQQAA